MTSASTRDFTGDKELAFHQMAVQLGDRIDLYLYVHNNADPGLNPSGEGIAEGMRAVIRLPEEASTVVVARAWLAGENTTPIWITDSVEFTSSELVVLAFIPGSAALKNHHFAETVGLDDAIISAGGVSIGYDALNGEIPGCFQYGAWITATAEVNRP